MSTPVAEETDLNSVEVVDRKEFLYERFDYTTGQHVTFLGPTQAGKTTLAFGLLKAVATPEVPAYVIVLKPRDRVVTDWAKTAKFRVIRDYPPPPNLTKFVKPPGYIVWPRHTFDEDPRIDDARLGIVFSRTLAGLYKKGDVIVFADEVFGLSNELGLDRRLNTIWSRGASMGCGLWASSQRPYSIPQLAYGSAEHLFLANDPDKRSRDRYGEIGGIDPDLVKELTSKLEKYQWLYVRRTGPEICIVDK
jgi:hypothetical protein